MTQATQVTLAEIAELLSEGAGVRITADELADADTFEDLGVDSLALLGAISALERTRRIKLPDNAESAESVGAFLEIVNSNMRKVS